jgi:hypothetical protein
MQLLGLQYCIVSLQAPKCVTSQNIFPDKVIGRHDLTHIACLPIAKFMSNYFDRLWQLDKGRYIVAVLQHDSFA